MRGNAASRRLRLRKPNMTLGLKLLASKKKSKTVHKTVYVNAGLFKDHIASMFYALSLIDDDVEIKDIMFPNLSVVETDNKIKIELILNKEVNKKD